MRYQFSFFVTIIILITTSCSNINKSYLSVPLTASMSEKISADIYVDTSKKLTGYAYGGYLFHAFKLTGDSKYADGITYGVEKSSSFFTFFSHVEEVKAMAAYNAMQGAGPGVEILVYPRYVIEEGTFNPFWKSIKVKVIGYPGTVVNIK